jgi:hypothetical protein
VRSSTPTGSWEGTGLKIVGNINLLQQVAYFGRCKVPPKKKVFEFNPTKISYVLYRHTEGKREKNVYSFLVGRNSCPGQ